MTRTTKEIIMKYVGGLRNADNENFTLIENQISNILEAEITTDKNNENYKKAILLNCINRLTDVCDYHPNL